MWFRKKDNSLCRVNSEDEGVFTFDIQKPLQISDTHWENYVLGVVDGIVKARPHKLGGFDCQFRTRQWADLYFQISKEVKVRRVFWPVYKLNRDLGLSRLTAQLQQRNLSMKLLLAKHHDLLHENPKRANTLVKNHIEMIKRTKSGDI